MIISNRRFVTLHLEGHGTFEFIFGDYSLMHLYAHNLNPIRAKDVFAVLAPEVDYYLENDLPTGDLEMGVDSAVLYDSDRFLEVVDFINNEILPELELESDDLVVKFGGKQNMENLINELPSCGIAALDEEYLDNGRAAVSVHNFGLLKELLELSIGQGVPYNVLYD